MKLKHKIATSLNKILMRVPIALDKKILFRQNIMSYLKNSGYIGDKL